MEDQKKSIIQPSIMPGVFLGIALIIFSLILYLLDINRQSGWNYLSLLVMALGLYWAMITVRDKTLGGTMSYGQAFGTGFWAGLVAVIISTIFTYLYVTVIDPGFAEEILIEAEENLLEANRNMSDEELDRALSITEMFTTPVMITVLGFLGGIFFATILSLIIAIFAKREGTIEIVEEEATKE